MIKSKINDLVTQKDGTKGKIIGIQEGGLIMMSFDDGVYIKCDIKEAGKFVLEFDEEYQKAIQIERKIKEEALLKRKRAKILDEVFRDKWALVKKLNEDYEFVSQYIKDEFKKLEEDKKYIETNLCIKDYCTFKSKFELPDYERSGVQDLYMYKYFLAYFLTYFYLYTRVELSNFLPEWRILSIGSGNSIDGAAATLVREVKSYVGIDKVLWHNNLYKPAKIVTKELKNVKFKDIDMEPNIIIFPKSILEIDSYELRNFVYNMINVMQNTDRIICIFAFSSSKINEAEKRAVRIVEEIVEEKFEKIFNWDSKDDTYLAQQNSVFGIVNGIDKEEGFFKLKCTRECNRECEQKTVNSMSDIRFTQYRISGWERKI